MIPTLRVLDVIRFRARYKQDQPGRTPVAGPVPGYAPGVQLWDEVRTALVKSVTVNDDESVTITYVPYATLECPDAHWCGHGCHTLRDQTTLFGWQEVVVLKHLDRDPDASWAENRTRAQAAMYHNPGYDPTM